MHMNIKNCTIFTINAHSNMPLVGIKSVWGGALKNALKNDFVCSNTFEITEVRKKPFFVSKKIFLLDLYQILEIFTILVKLLDNMI